MKYKTVEGVKEKDDVKYKVEHNASAKTGEGSTNKKKIISKLPNHLKKTISMSEQGEAKPLIVTALQRE